MYQYDQRPGTRIADTSQSALEQLRDSEYSVLVGRNNCGKSYLLKTLTSKWGATTSYLGPARYQNFNLLGYFTPNRNKRNEKWSTFTREWGNQHQNIDNSPVNLQQGIAELSDKQRDSLKEIVKLILDVELDIRHTVEGNSMSQQYVSCGGHNISYTSSGFRLIMTLLTSLLDAEYDTFLVDEPELGISPEAQGILADFLFEREHRKKYFSHIRTLVLATHSTIFLDRQHIKNNFRVEKSGDEISLRQVDSQGDFNQIHFFLLGNRFETLYLPSIITLVEGKCDHKFIERVFSLLYYSFQISVVPANSDARIKEILNIAKGLLTDIQKSPYRDRLFVVLDSVHGKGIPAETQAMGVLQENIITWEKNGIEFYYPPTIIDQIFGAGGEIEISNDAVSRNGVSYKKNELVEKVISRMQADTPMHPEFREKFLARIEKTLGLATTPVT